MPQETYSVHSGDGQADGKQYPSPVQRVGGIFMGSEGGWDNKGNKSAMANVIDCP